MDDDDFEKKVAKEKEDERLTAIAFDVNGIGKELEEKRKKLHEIGNKIMEKKFLDMLRTKNLYGLWEDVYNYVDDEEDKTYNNKSETLLRELGMSQKSKFERTLDETDRSQALASDGGRRKKKRSTGRKKRRGKKTRKYRRKY